MRIPNGFVILVSAAILVGYSAAPADFPEFTVHRIDEIGDKIGQTALVDIDRDGDLDWVAGEADHGGSRIWWWEYRGADEWIRHTLGAGHTDVGAAVHDVNGDGWIDMVSGSRLLMNTGRPKDQAFEVHEIGTLYSHDTEFVDINGDGKLDLIANWDKAGLYWYEVPEDPTKSWPAHTIDLVTNHQVHGGVSPQPVGDIDGDGDTDVVTAQAWYENLDGKGLRWEAHKNLDLGEKHQYGIAVRTWVGDMDGDGDADVVQAEADNPDGRVAWFENDGKGNWVRHMIRDEGQGQDFHSLAVADFDGDGDLDVFSGAAVLSASKKFGCYIWENAGEDRWVERLLATKPCHEAVAGDVDADGDIDICSKPWSTGREHFFLRNTLKELK